MLTKPSANFDPARSMLKNDHFQMAYVTNDLARAQQVFKDRYGIESYIGTEGPTPSGGHIHVELAWSGGIMFELIETSGPGSEFYNARLPDDGFAIRHHHLGYMIWNEADWHAFEEKVKAEHWEVAFNANLEDFMRACYIHAPELDHYLEYIFPEEAGLAFFNSVPEG
jgi:extradiol dioxygenase family protein